METRTTTEGALLGLTGPLSAADGHNGHTTASAADGHNGHTTASAADAPRRLTGLRWAAWALVLPATLVLAVAVPLRASRSASTVQREALPAPRISESALVALSARLGAVEPAYRIRADGRSLSAANPAQRLRIGFAASGIRLSRAQQSLTLRVAAGIAPTAHGNRVAYDRPGLREYYLNGPAGLEQGFVLAKPARRSAVVRLALDLLGRRPEASRDSHGWITLSSSGRPFLRYGEIHALDAHGRALPAAIAVSGSRLLLRVDARGATFPVRIDPLVQEVGKLGSGEEVGLGTLGSSIALSADGDTALVGAPHDGELAGGAWVFVRSGSRWAQQGSELIAGEGAASGSGGECGEAGEEGEGCGFGGSVALSADGDTALIGSPAENGKLGAAWVFTRDGKGSWSEEARLLPGPGEESATGHFGRAVALSADGREALVAAPMNHAAKGSVWAFTRSGALWSREPGSLTGAEEAGEGRFGRRIALSADGSTALIGGPTDDRNAGAAWVFTRGAEGWAQEGGKLTPSDEVDAGRFGYSLALSGDNGLAVIGARADAQGLGAVWTFAPDETGQWRQQGAKLTATGTAPGSEFGSSLALSPSGTLLAGAPGDVGHTGAVYVFDRAGGGWAPRPERLAGGETAGKSTFGAAVAISADGKLALVGGPRDAGKVGAVWAFEDLPFSTRPPFVEGVAPSSGPASGGTAVTLSGENLSAATAVRFGTAHAASFHVVSATAIEAISPVGDGTVDVTVTTPAGTSLVSPHDRFDFEGIPPGAGGVLDTRAGSSASCRVLLAGGRTITVGGRAALAVRIARRGSGVCQGRLSVSVLRPHGPRLVRKTIAGGGFTVSSARPRTVTLRLGVYGRRLLARKHGRLEARLTIVKLAPGAVSRSSATVRLSLARRH